MTEETTPTQGVRFDARTIHLIVMAAEAVLKQTNMMIASARTTMARDSQLVHEMVLWVIRSAFPPPPVRIDPDMINAALQALEEVLPSDATFNGAWSIMSPLHSNRLRHRVVARANVLYARNAATTVQHFTPAMISVFMATVFAVFRDGALPLATAMERMRTVPLLDTTMATKAEEAFRRAGFAAQGLITVPMVMTMMEAAVNTLGGNTWLGRASALMEENGGHYADDIAARANDLYEADRRAPGRAVAEAMTAGVSPASIQHATDSTT